MARRRWNCWLLGDLLGRLPLSARSKRGSDSIQMPRIEGSTGPVLCIRAWPKKDVEMKKRREVHRSFILVRTG